MAARRALAAIECVDVANVIVSFPLTLTLSDGGLFLVNSKTDFVNPVASFSKNCVGFSFSLREKAGMRGNRSL